MCLYFNPKCVVQKKLFRDREVITCWKAFRLESAFTGDDPTVLCSPIMRNVVTTKNGFFCSDRKSKNLYKTEETNTEVEKGIYVYTSLAAARISYREYKNIVILPVTCYAKNVVATNLKTKIAVFTRIKLNPGHVKQYKTEGKRER